MQTSSSFSQACDTVYIFRFTGANATHINMKWAYNGKRHLGVASVFSLVMCVCIFFKPKSLVYYITKNERTLKSNHVKCVKQQLLKNPKLIAFKCTNEDREYRNKMYFTFCALDFLVRISVFPPMLKKSINYLFPKQIYTWIYFLLRLVASMR